MHSMQNRHIINRKRVLAKEIAHLLNNQEDSAVSKVKYNLLSVVAFQIQDILL